MSKANRVYVKLSIEKEAIENIRTVMENKTNKDYLGSLNLSIIIDGPGYVIPLKTSNYIKLEEIQKLINNGKYDFDCETINLLYEIKPVDSTEEIEADLIRF